MNEKPLYAKVETEQGSNAQGKKEGTKKGLRRELKGLGKI